MKQKNPKISGVNQEETRSKSQFRSNAGKHQNLDLSIPPPHVLTWSDQGAAEGMAA